MSLPLAVSSKKVGRYRLLGELGQGGTATVFLAVATGPAGFNKLVVLKQMKPQFSTEPGFAEMFMTEARLAARLNHPNIVQTNEVLEHDGLPIIVMEYLEGKSLADIAAAARVDSSFTLQHHLLVISEALSGLHHSHELADYDGRPLELVHRDVTPHNLLVTYEGQVKILDFGIAKLKNSSVETETGVVKGKLRYIPPEQIIGERVDRRSDIYSVGVMLWEAAVGEKMWRGLGDAAVMNRVLNEQVPSPREHRHDVDPRLERLIMKALSPDPADRHQTAAELQDELDAVRDALPAAVSLRNLAPSMEALFDSDRSKTRRLIQQRIGEGDETGAPPAAARTVGHTDSTKSPWLMLLGTGVLGVGGWLLVSQLPANNEATAEELETPRAASVSSAPAPSIRRVRITAFPQHARIELDGRLLPSNPYQDELPADDELHTVVVRAPGFAESQAQLRLNADIDEVFQLSELAPQAATNSALATGTASASTGALATPQPSARRAPTVQPSAAPLDCDPPYRIDSRGVKRFKLECM